MEVVVSSILLSVKPEYVEQIFMGKKLFEYRKRQTRKSIHKIIIYATYPMMKVVGDVEIIGVISGSPTYVWEQTKQSAGISRDRYMKYFKGSESAYAYQLGKTTVYELPKDLLEFGISYVPQSFIYIDE